MPYKPKIIAGRVKDTGYPIDGHVLTFSQWDYDNRESWHLYGWDEASDEAVMLTMYQAEKDEDMCLDEDFESFKEKWEAGEWEPDGVFWLPLDQVEVVTVFQEEEPADSSMSDLFKSFYSEELIDTVVKETRGTKR